MKVTLWGINYAPEYTGIGPYSTKLCETLAGRGHKVRAVTGFAYYPAWEKTAKDRGRLFSREEVNGVTLHRCWQYVPKRVSTLKRILHESSFICSSFLRLLFLPAPDVYVVISPPLLLGFAARVLSFFKRRPYIFHVKDLQPDAALGLGMVKPGLFTRLLYRFEAIAYTGAIKVGGISDGMLNAYRKKGVPEEKIIFFPDSFDAGEFAELPMPGAFRQRFNFEASDLLVIYSGNIGVKQGLEITIGAAERLKDTPVRIVICGDGAAKPALEETMKARNLENLHLLPLLPRDQYLEMLVDADICLVTQQAGSGAYFFPCKLLATLAAARPVVSVADEQSELFLAMDKGDFGWNVLPDDEAALAECLKAAVKDPEERTRKGENGKVFIQAYEDRQVLPAFEQVLESLA